MKPLRILVSGAGGKMGLAIREVATEVGGFEIVAAVDRANKSLPDVSGKGDVQAVVDFSGPELFLEILDWAVRSKVPFVSGTTGLGDKEHKALEIASKTIPALWAPNFSIGIQLFSDWIKGIAPYSSHYSPQIEEIHHSEKKDSPSGTALFLQGFLAGVSKSPPPPPISIRAGGVFGEHTLKLFGQEEVITINHSAINRKVFARGALTSCEWIMGQEPGLYKFLEVFQPK